MKAPKVMLVVPTRGYVWHETARRAALFQRSEQCDEMLYVQSKASVCGARNEGRAAFLESACDVLVMMDDDMLPPPQACAGLAHVAQRENALAGGVCAIVQRGRATIPAVYQRTGGSKWEVDAAAIRSAQNVPVDGIGFGMVAMTRELTDKVGPFRDRTSGEGVIEMGEDLDYCLRTRTAGHSIICVTSLLIDHFVPVHLNELTFANTRVAGA